VNSALLLLMLAGGAFAVSFLLSGMEAGLPALNRVRIRHLARRGQSSARLLHGFLTAPEHFLWTILVGNTLANVTLLGLAFHRLHTWLGDRRLVLTAATAGTVFLLYMLAELLPKMLFRQFPTRLCLALARPFAVVHGVLRPAVRLIAGLAWTFLKVTGGKHVPGRLFQNREELRQLLQESAQSLSGEEQGMVNRVLDMQRITVGSLMVPLARVVCVPADAPLREVCRLCRETDHDRLPVRQPDGRGIAGVVSLPTILYREDCDLTQPAARLLEPALYLPEHHSLEAALRQFQRSGQRLAVVLDPQRREIGILTLTDILRFIFGEVAL
jgi:CBS domain containing-hemolysin-like protein